MSKWEPVNILVVDDLPDKRLALETVLEELGENIISASSGRDALRRLLENDFAVILLDYNMPEMDGFETAALIRQHKRCAHTPIIFVTAFADELLAAKGYALGAVDYILSPVVPSILRAKVSVFTDLFRKSEQIRKQAEQLRQLEKLENEARNAAILNTALDCIITFDEMGRIVEFNRAAETAFGCSTKRALACNLTDFIHFSWPNRDRSAGTSTLRYANYAELIGERLEAVAVRSKGGDFPVEIAITPVSWDGVRYFTAFVRDITDRKNIERRRNVRLEIAQILAEVSDISQAISRVIDVLCRQLEWDFGAFWKADHKTETLRCSQIWDGLSPEFNDFRIFSELQTFVKGAGLPGRVWNSGVSHWIAEFANDSNFPRASVAKQTGLHSGFAFPVGVGDDFFGVLEFLSSRPRDEDVDLLELTATIGGQVRQFLDRKMSEEKLRKNEQELTDLFENASYGLHWTTPDGVILRANQAELDLVQRKQEDYVGRNLAEFFVDCDAIQHLLERVRAGESVKDFPSQVRRPDGTLRQIVISCNGFWEEGTLTQIHAFTLDVTDQRLAEEAQQRLALIVESSQDAIISKSLDGIIQSWNAGAERLYGYAASEVIGKPISIIVPPDRQVEQEGILERLIQGERVEHFETVRVAKDKRELHVSLTVSPLRDVNGKIVGASKVARDVTSRKLAEVRRRRQEKNVVLLNDAASHLLTTDSQDRMVSELFEQIREHLHLDVYLNFMVDENREQLRLASFAGLDEAAMKEFSRLEMGQQINGLVARQRHSYVADHILESQDPALDVAKRFGIRTFACNPLLVGPRLLGTLTFASRSRDRFDEDELDFLRALSHYVAAAFERLQLIGKLREADRRKDEFLATLAHELRNPLAPIRNALHILKQSNVDPAILSQMREIADRQIQHMARLLEDLMDVSRISRGMVSLRKQPVDLTSLITRAAEMIRPNVDEQQHLLSLDLPREKMLVFGDLTRLEQILMNLLNNACRYTNPGGKICISLVRENGSALIRVSDNGIGISREMIPHVFDLFVQAERRLERSRGGIGIGLTLVRRLVELHGGNIVASSKGIGQGSDFEVRIPMILEKMEDAPDSHEPQSELSVASSQRILVVDDNTDAAESLAALLRLEGQDVRTAYDGLTALEIAAEFRPAVVFLDIGMPNMNGYEVCRELRKREGSKTALIAALTGWGQEADRMRSNDSGFDWHLVKPVEMEAIRKLLELSSIKVSV